MTKKILIQLAFEAGRTYENRLISFGLNDCISGEDLAYSKGFGSQLKMKGDLSNFSQIFATRGLNEAKIKSLFEPIEFMNELQELE